MLVKELKTWLEGLPEEASLQVVNYEEDYVDLECRQAGVYFGTKEMGRYSKGD